MTCRYCGSEYDLRKHTPEQCAKKHTFCKECRKKHVDECGVSTHAPKGKKKSHTLEHGRKIRKTMKFLQGVKENSMKRVLLYAEHEFSRKKVVELTKKCENLRIKADGEEVIRRRLQKKIDQEQKKKNVKCSECGSCDSEINMQICKSCVLDNHESLEVFAVSCATELPSAAICAVCAIRNHIKHNHDVLDYFPILSLNQYNSHVDILKPKRERNRNVKDEINVEMGTIMTTFDKGEKELDKMYDMMRRSKTSDIQNDLQSKISGEIENFERILLDLKGVLEKTNLEFKTTVDKVAAENENRNSEDFVEKVGDIYKSVNVRESDENKKKVIVVVRSRMKMNSKQTYLKKCKN